MAQLVAHPLDVREVTSSSLVSSTTIEKSELRSHRDGVRISCLHLNWTIDVDDNSDADLLLLSGNRKLPPNDAMTPVIEAVRLCENRFMRCVKEWK